VRRSAYWCHHWCKALAVVATLIGGATGAAAQTAPGSLFGTVTDASGSRLPGVTVVASSGQLLGGQEVRTTTDQGTYRFPSLPIGTYSLTFELSGFQGVKHERIILQAGQSLGIDAELQVAQLQETLTVFGESPVVDIRTSALTNRADLATMENIPMAREFTQILNIMPGITNAMYDFAPVNNVHGSTARQNQYALDGVNTNDPVTNTTSTLLPPDAFQEVQVTTAGISAEFGDAGGGVFNYVTKSGGDQLSGGGNTFYQGRRLESDNVSDELRAGGLSTTAGFNHISDSGVLLGGPIRRNRAWFFGNYRYVNMAERRADFQAPLDTFDHTYFVKGTVRISDANRLETSLYFRDYLNFPYTAVASFANSGDPRVWTGVEKNNYHFAPSWQAVLSDKTILNVRASTTVFQLLATNPNNDGSTMYLDQVTGIFTGGDTHTFGDNRRNRHAFKTDLSHYRDQFLGSHSIKVGLDIGLEPAYAERFVQGARGPGELIGCSDRCLSQTPDTVHLTFNGAPFRVRLYNSPLLQKQENRTLSAFIQDQWVLGDRVTLNLGLRFDRVNGSLPESTAGPGEWQERVVYPRQDGLVKISSVAPRLGAAWDLRGDRQSTLRVSLGRFYNQFNTSYVGTVAPSGFGYRELDWTDRNGDMVYQVGEEGILRADTRPNPALLPRLDPDLKNMYTDVYTVGFERAVSATTSLAVTGVFKRDGNIIGTINANVPWSAYDPINVVNPLNGESLVIYTLRTAFRGVAGQTVLTNPGGRPGEPVELERKYDGVEIVARKRMQDRHQWEVSYVYGRGEGNVGNGFGGGSSSATYTNPNTYVNRYGDLPMGPRQQFKAMGAYLAPGGFVVSAFFQALSGIPTTNAISGTGSVAGATTVRFFQTQYPQMQSETFIDVSVEPAGTHRFEPQIVTDLRLEKRFDIGAGSLSAVLDMFNLFNAGEVIEVSQLRLDHPLFNNPSRLQAPRQIRIGARWSF
jgi:outer membrane receptor protein involved in Fe transport